MALDSVHPEYAKQAPEWLRLRDFIEGERQVKSKSETYLPATKSMKLDGMGSTANGTKKLGQEVYDAYKLRAVFPEYLSDALDIFMGMLHNKSAVIELPEELEYLRDSATELGEPLELLLQRINLEQLSTGRLGLLLDLPAGPSLKPEPFIALYAAESIRNWNYDPKKGEPDQRSDLDFVILDESGYSVDDNFEWTTRTKFRVLMKTTTAYTCGVFSVDGAGTPVYSDQEMFAPMVRGRTLSHIPFLFVGTMDIHPSVGKAPLSPLASICETIYRGEADYRQNLFMQGQDTLVIIGDRVKPGVDAAENEEVRVGANSRIEIEASPGADVKYVGVSGEGLSEQRNALENDRKRGESKSGQLIDAAKGEKESGTALRTRVGAQTATLNQIAKTGALALQLILREAAAWVGADPAKVKVTPNLEFADYQMSGQDLVNLMTAKRDQGAPLSEESVHRLMVQGNLTSFDYQTERAMIDKEEPFESPEAKLARELAEKRAAAGDRTGENLNQGPAPKDPANPAPAN